MGDVGEENKMVVVKRPDRVLTAEEGLLGSHLGYEKAAQGFFPWSAVILLSSERPNWLGCYMGNR